MDLASKAVGLAIVFGLLAIWAWAMRKKGARFALPFRRSAASDATVLRHEATLVLSPQHRLHLVQCDQTRFLVLTSPAGGSLLDLGAHTSFLPALSQALSGAPDKPPGPSEDRP